jgi:MarR family transcriptional regulator, 2-MHQ and catechol-resistance regulon repressor
MSPSTAKKGSALFYRTLPLMKKIFLGAPAGRRGKLPPHLFGTLLCLHFHGRQKMSAISDRLGLSKPLVTQHVNRLVAEGYFRRFPDPADRRIIYIDITAKGAKYAGAVSTFFQGKGEKALSSLSANELSRFVESLETIHEILSRIDCPEKKGIPLPGGKR